MELLILYPRVQFYTPQASDYRLISKTVSDILKIFLLYFFLSVALKKKTCVKSDMYRVYQNCNMWYMMISESLLCVNYVILLKNRNVKTTGHLESVDMTII